MRETKQNTLSNILDSDDELPSQYVETADVPAYKQDNRFTDIQNQGHNKWIDVKYSKYYEKKINERLHLPSLYTTFNEDVVFDKTKHQKVEDKTLISSGILSNDDIFCLKSIESTTSDTIFLWLINYLTYKNMQSHYSFMKSCLVCNYLDTINSNKFAKEQQIIKNFNFEFVIKK